ATVALADALGLVERSMGMSDDLELACELGTTEVRLGRALFGPRGGGARRPRAPRQSPSSTDQTASHVFALSRIRTRREASRPSPKNATSPSSHRGTTTTRVASPIYCVRIVRWS